MMFNVNLPKPTTIGALLCLFVSPFGICFASSPDDNSKARGIVLGVCSAKNRDSSHAVVESLEQKIIPFADARQELLGLIGSEPQRVSGCTQAIAQVLQEYLVTLSGGGSAEGDVPRQRGSLQKKGPHLGTAVVLLALEARVPQALKVLVSELKAGQVDSLVLIETHYPQQYGEVLLAWAAQEAAAREKFLGTQQTSRGPSWFLVCGRYLSYLKSLDRSQAASLEKGHPQMWHDMLAIASQLRPNEKGVLRPDLVAITSVHAGVAGAYRSLQTNDQARLLWLFGSPNAQ